MCRNFFPGISGGVLTPLTPPLGSATAIYTQFDPVMYPTIALE